MSFAYLASPYTNPHDRSDLLRCERNHQAVCRVAAELMQRGVVVFSPIAHSHAIAYYMDESLRASYEFWMVQDLAMLALAEKLVVVKLPGWDSSYGVNLEIAFAHEHDIPVEYLEGT